MDNYNEEDFNMIMKIIIVGGSSVGKTNLLLRFTKNEFEEDSKNTIGVGFVSHDFKLNNMNLKI